MSSDRSNKLSSGLSATQSAGGLKDSSGFSRRQFFQRSAMAGAATLSGGIFQALVARTALAADDRGRSGPGYGALIPAGDELALPLGFHYSIVSAEGDIMSDGYPVPKAMDGMATFALSNWNVLLIRNHEDSDPGSRFRPRPPNSTSTSVGILNSILNTHYGPRDFAYDAFAGGGTTSIEVDPHTRRVVQQHWSLVGTFRNCAGGPTPWGSWLSCEETLEIASPTNSDSPVFLAALGVHVLFGLSCVATGVVAMLSRKRPGRHPRFGTIYYYCLSAVFTSATILSVMRWAENYHQFILGTLSFATASLGRMALRRRWRDRIRLHITCMGLSYILLLTAFYVDNGRNLPLWNKLPRIAFWVLPAAVGIPFIVRALLRHPLVRRFSTADATSGGKGHSQFVRR